MTDTTEGDLTIAAQQQRNRLDEALFGEQSGPVRIGQYIVLATLGEGAMGTVYEAFDTELDRKVALKQLSAPSGPDLDDRQERLVAEATLMARVEHPNVVAVYHVVGNASETYLVMQVVVGVTLTHWLATPRSRAELLDVFEQAGMGLAAVHEHGIVHRDFKPDNVLVSEGGRTFVTDFGLARLVDMSAPRRDGRRASGTPAYMAPETTRSSVQKPSSDQFGFSVALWEALYGERPPVGDSRASVGTGRAAHPPRPAVPTWLRRVVERGLAHDPDERWPSMHALLTALRDDPTSRRRRRVAASAIVVVAGSAFVWLRHVEAEAERKVIAACEAEGQAIQDDWNEEAREAVRHAFAATELPFASDMNRLVERELSGFVDSWARARVENCRADGLGLRVDEAEAAVVRACLDERRMMLRATRDALSSASALEVENAGLLMASLPVVDHCQDSRVRPVHVDLGANPADRAKAEEILGLLARAATQEELLAFEPALGLIDLASERAESLGWEPLRLRTSNRRGWLEHRLQQNSAAEATLEASFFAALRAGNKEEAGLAASGLLSVVGVERARITDAVRWEKAALALLDAAGASTTDIRRADVRHAAARVYRDSAEHGGAVEAATDAVRIYKQNLRANHPALAGPYNTLGIVYQHAGKFEESLVAYEHALALINGSFGRFHPRAAAVLSNLGNVCSELGDFGPARDYYERAIGVLEAIGPQALGELGAALLGLAIFHKRRGRYAQARATVGQAIELFRKKYGETDPRVGGGVALLGDIASAEGLYEEALGHHSMVVTLFEASLGREHPNYGNAVGNRGHALQRLGRHEEALIAFERALSVVEKSLGAEHPDMALWLQDSGISRRALGDLQGGLALHTQALGLHEKNHGTGSAKLVDPLQSIGLLHLELGAQNAAHAYFERARKIYAASGQTEPAILGGILFGLARSTAGDRVLAEETALSARAEYAKAGTGQKDRLDEIDTWLRALP